MLIRAEYHSPEYHIDLIISCPPVPATVPAPILPLRSLKGRKGGRQVSYNGFVYSHDRIRPNGSHYWQCKDRRKYTPNCGGRLHTDGDTVLRETPHSHPVSH